MYQDVKKYISSCYECQLQANKQQDKKLYFIWISVLWEKVVINTIHMSSNQKKKFIIITYNNLSDWSEAEVLSFFHLKHVAQFLYKKLICWHECFWKLINDEEKENKKKMRKFLMKYFIKHVIILLYNLQANEMIKRNHQLIINVLFKLMNDFIRYDQNDWVTHFSSVFLADWTIIKMSTEMTLFCMMYEYEVILSIKLNVLMWQTLSWNIVKTCSDLIVMQAQQIKKCDKNIKKTYAHL